MESLDDLLVKQRKEQKDLQASITQKKKNASKKTRKGVNSECEILERKLKEKHDQERALLVGNTAAEVEDVPDVEDSEAKEKPTNGMDDVTESLDKTGISETLGSEDGQPKKRNRQKERLARRAAEVEASVEEAKKEASNQPDPKAIEREKMMGHFKEMGLVEKQIRPDGHCLFSAVADQLDQVGIPLDTNTNAELEGDQPYKVVRKAAANYIEEHPDDFVPFLDEPLGGYVDKIRNTAEWGGHLELLALAKTYNVDIFVLRDTGTQTIESGASSPETIWLAYYLHGYGLGEHYNSVRKPA